MVEGLFKGIPIIETNRLILRNFRIEDTNEYFSYHNDPDVIKHYDWKPNTLAEAKEDIELIINSYKQSNYIRWAITLKGTDTIIGDCGLMTGYLKGEISYILSKEHWGTGIATEAINAIISCCFHETDMIRIQALSQPDNHSSSKLLTKTGFQNEGLLRKYGHNLITKQFDDLFMWSVLREDFYNYSEYSVTFI